MKLFQATRRLNRASNSLATTAYARLKAAIRAHEFAPGDRMREADLAAMLNISRTPVRDALRQLEAEGLLEAAPRRGLVVATLDQQQVTEIYALRYALECLAARLAARQASLADIAALRDNLDRQGETPEASTDRLAELNGQFHQLIYRASRNEYLAAALAGLETSLALLPGTTYSGSKRPAEALVHHQELLEAIERHEEARAEEVAGEHIRSAERIRLMMIAGVPVGRR